jgi:hypothetical protein
MSKSVGQFAHVRLFVEGIELPVINVSVTASINSASAANIDILPDDAAFSFHPRTVVHVFYYDWEEAAYGGTGRPPTIGNLGAIPIAFSPVEEIERGGATIPLTSTGPNGRTFRPPDLDRAYKLLFCGEVFTVTYAKQGPGSRQITLQCYDFSNLWDTYYVYTASWNRAEGDEIAGSTANFNGAITGAFDDIVSSAEEVIRRALSRPKPANPGFGEVSETFGGLFSILETFFGIQGKYAGQDSWITISERRVRVLDQIGADSGETASEFFKKSAFDEWLLGSVGKLGPLASIRDVIQLICSHIFYDVAPNPVAAYTPGYRTIPNYDILAEDSELRTTEAFDAVADRRLGNPVRGSYRITSRFGPRTPPKTAFGVGSAFHRGIDIGDRGRTDRGVLAVADGVVRGEYNSRKVAVSRNGRSGFKELTVTIDHGEGLTSTYRHLDSVSVAFGATVTKGQEIGIIGNTGNSGLPHLHYELSYNGQKIDPEYYLNNNALYAARQQAPAQIFAIPVVDINEETGTTRNEDATLIREKLLTQIFRPDVWFCPAPLCNVFFPTEYSSFTFTRQMLREVTRLQVESYRSVISESDKILNRYAWAPQFDNSDVNLAQGAIGAISQKIIFPHEKFSGIIPGIEKISQLSFFVERELQLRNASANAAVPLEGTTSQSAEVNGDIELWARRVAHYKLLTNRYAARSASVNGRFMPRAVCGFPAVVIGTDSPYDLSQATQTSQTSAFEAAIARDSRPVHFIGSVTSVSHSLSAEGQAFTTLVLSHVRSHKTQGSSEDPLLDRIRKDGSLDIQTPNESPTYEPITYDFGPDSGTEATGGVAEFIHALLFEFGLGTMFGPTSSAPYIRRSLAGAWIDTTGETTEELAVQALLAARNPRLVRKLGQGRDANFLDSALERVRQEILPQVSRFKGPNGKPIVDFKFTGSVTQVPVTIKELFRSSITLDLSAKPGVGGQFAPLGAVTTAGQNLSIKSYTAAADLWSSALIFDGADPDLHFLATLGDTVEETGTTFRRIYRIIPAFRGITITESTYDDPDRTKLPIEEAIRPAWVSDEYANVNIGKLYKKLFTCDSVISKVGKPLPGYISPSIEQAVDIIAAEYTEHPEGEDRARYIYDLTRRGHADLLQVLGAKLPGDIDSGGFHSAAVGPYENKEFLDLDSGLTSPNDQTAGTQLLVENSIDPRKDRQERVLRYLSRVSITRGFRG